MLETTLLVDAYSLIYRAFYAIRSLTGPRGEPVNAIFGLTKMLRKLRADHSPARWAAVFDLGAPQQRLAVLPSYKAHRPPTPPDLEAQLPGLRDMLTALRIPIVEIHGEEADDIVATLATLAATAGDRVLIASNDKDFMQLVGPSILMIRADSKESALVNSAAVEARFGVRPEQMVDYLSLLGDAVDNIPGVTGVGEKTAADLLRQFRNLDDLLARCAEIPKPKLRDAIIAHADQLRANRELIKLRTDLPLPVRLDELRVRPHDMPRLRELCQQFGFKALLAELEKEANVSGDLFAPR